MGVWNQSKVEYFRMYIALGSCKIVGERLGTIKVFHLLAGTCMCATFAQAYQTLRLDFKYVPV